MFTYGFWTGSIFAESIGVLESSRSVSPLKNKLYFILDALVNINIFLLTEVLSGSIHRSELLQYLLDTFRNISSVSYSHSIVLLMVKDRSFKFSLLLGAKMSTDLKELLKATGMTTNEYSIKAQFITDENIHAKGIV